MELKPASETTAVPPEKDVQKKSGNPEIPKQSQADQDSTPFDDDEPVPTRTQGKEEKLLIKDQATSGVEK